MFYIIKQNIQSACACEGGCLVGYMSLYDRDDLLTFITRSQSPLSSAGLLLESDFTEKMCH